MRGSIDVTLILLLLSLPLSADTVQPPPPLPALNGQVIAGPIDEVTWDVLRGTPVAVELFATWCGPCWGELEKWDRLARRWSDSEMKFLLLSNESPAILQERLLDQWELDSWVVTDRGQLFDTLSRCGLPLVLLVDRAGELQVAVHPGMITEEVFERHAAGQPVDIDSCQIAPARPQAASAPAPAPAETLFRVGPTAMKPDSYLHNVGPTRLRAEGVTLESVLPLVYDVSRHRLVVDAVLPDHRLDLTVRAPETVLRSVARQGVERTFRLESHEEERELPVYVLRTTPARNAKRIAASAEPGLRSFGPGRVGPGRITSGELAVALESSLDRPVFDETGEVEPFAAENVWQGEQAEIERQLRDVLGLELVPAQRTVPVLVIDDRSSTDEEDPGSGPQGATAG